MPLDIRWVPSPNNSGGDYDKWFVCIHATVTHETPDGAELVAGWFADPDFDASTQYVVDRTDIIQTVAETAYAWSAGTTANRYGIHIELVAMPGQTRGEWSDAYSDDELRLAARLTAQLCAKYGIEVRKIDAGDLRTERGGICGHADVRDAWHETTHWDPGPNFPWDRFIDYVREAQEDDVSAEDVWNYEIPQQGAKDPDATQKAKWALAQARQRATEANRQSRQALAAVRAVGKALGPTVEAAVEKAVAAVLAEDPDATPRP